MTKDQKKLHRDGDEFVGTISHINFWDKFISLEYLKWLGFGCGGSEHRAILPWALILNHTVGFPDIRRPSTCKDVDGRSFATAETGNFFFKILASLLILP